MQVSLGENMEKAFRYQTGCGQEETLYVTDKKVIWTRPTQTDEIVYSNVSQIEKTLHSRLTGGCVFFFVLCFLSLICGVAAVLYGVWDSQAGYYIASGVCAVVAIFACVFSAKLKRKDYGVKIYLVGGGELWLDIGDKKISALVANEITAKVCKA